MGGKATAIKAAEGVQAPADAPPTADGYLVRFTSADDPDITAMKDFFTSETYFGEAERVPVYFHHGLPVVIRDAATGATKTIGPGKTKIGTGSLKADETGIFIDAIIDEAGEYREPFSSSSMRVFSAGRRAYRTTLSCAIPSRMTQDR
jgi:hypothetical protein